MSVLIITLYLVATIGMLVSNKSTFKILFSFLSLLVVYVFFEFNGFSYSREFLTVTTMMLFLITVYIKFSQTGKVRVLPSERNFHTNNIAPIVGIITISLFILVLLSGIADNMLIKELSPIVSLRTNLIDNSNVKFIAIYSVFLLIVTICKKVKDR